MLEKNQQYSAIITDITSEGNGVCRIDGMAVFVPNTAVGDEINLKIVKVLKSYAFAIVTNIIKPSPDRIQPDCIHFNKCGGCIFRHISYETECKIKSDIVKNAFIRIGGLNPEFLPFVGCENISEYRNKAQYPLACVDGKAVCGFFAPRSHRVIPIDKCILQPEIFSRIVSSILDYINKSNIKVYNETNHSGSVRHIYIRQGFHSKEIMVCIVAKSDISTQLAELCSILTSSFPDIKSIILNINPDNTNVILGKKCLTLYGSDFISDFMCGNKIQISPLSFYQVNTAQAEKLYSIAENFACINKNSTIADLFCGAGTIGLSMARKVYKLFGIEIIPQAIDNAIANASANNISNAQFICGDAGQAFSQLISNGISPDIIFLDPPRKGCDMPSISQVVNASPSQIIMISCNPSTAARDAKIFSQLGYSTSKVCGVDMFPRTGHVETVVLLSKLRSEHHIDIELKTDELDLTASESKATYDEIKAYVKEHSGLSVSSLYIAQVKQKCGIIERENYNRAKSKDTKQPKCPKDKETAIMDALKYFKMK